MRGEGAGKPPLPPSGNPFKPFCDAVIDPIVDLLGPEDDELVIVSVVALCFTPRAAVIESIKIHTVPSPTSYQLISSVPAEGHHKNTGALLVGNQAEVEMIASILNTTLLTGKPATKAEVMRRMSSVGLIHIAAHGNKLTGEITLPPNLGSTSKFPQKRHLISKIAEVQAANIRARLVMLSYCHSGRGRIFKGEGDPYRACLLGSWCWTHSLKGNISKTNLLFVFKMLPFRLRVA